MDSYYSEHKKINIDRDPDYYLTYTFGDKTANSDISIMAITAMIIHVSTLKNLRPGRDTQGILKKVKMVGGRDGRDHVSYMTADWAEFVPYPISKLLQILLPHIFIVSEIHH
jgi:hypothetical protein